MSTFKKIGVVIPVYGSPTVVEKLCSRLHSSLQTITEDYEIILVEDGSPDNSWTRICEESAKDPRVQGLRLSRNFGQHNAISAGLAEVQAEWVVVMDCDLQDQPEEIPKLYKQALTGYELVFALRENRQDSWCKVMMSRIFYSVLGFLIDTKLDARIANFGIYSHQAIATINSLNDSMRYFPAMCQWIGFRKCGVAVEHAAREVGHSSYNWSRLLSLAFNNIVSFSNKPLRMVVLSGMMICVMTFVVALFFLMKYLNGEIVVSGFMSLILSVWFLGGGIIFIVGIVGIYVGKVFDQSKKRPIYIISRRSGAENNPVDVA